MKTAARILALGLALLAQGCIHPAADLGPSGFDCPPYYRTTPTPTPVTTP